MTEQSKAEQELVEKIARVICAFAEDNEGCSTCKENSAKHPFPDCFTDIREQTDRLLIVIKEALLELAKEAGCKEE